MKFPEPPRPTLSSKPEPMGMLIGDSDIITSRAVSQTKPEVTPADATLVAVPFHLQGSEKDRRVLFAGLLVLFSALASFYVTNALAGGGSKSAIACQTETLGKNDGSNTSGVNPEGVPVAIARPSVGPSTREPGLNPSVLKNKLGPSSPPKKTVPSDERLGPSPPPENSYSETPEEVFVDPLPASAVDALLADDIELALESYKQLAAKEPGTARGVAFAAIANELTRKIRQCERQGAKQCSTF